MLWATGDGSHEDGVEPVEIPSLYLCSPEMNERPEVGSESGQDVLDLARHPRGRACEEAKELDAVPTTTLDQPRQQISLDSGAGFLAGLEFGLYLIQGEGALGWGDV